MKPSRIYCLGSFGKAVAETAAIRIAGPSATLPVEAQSPISADLSNVAAFAVVLSEPDILSLEAIAEAAGARAWLAVFPFERHIVVTPLFSAGTACARCFVKRWLCQPPFGYHGETVLAIAALAHERSLGGYRNLSPLAVPLAASLMAMNWCNHSEAAVCFDTGGLHVESARIRPLHGCSSCRSDRASGSERFATFGASVSTVLGDTRMREPLNMRSAEY
jgi:bacteriocin biosynthesis cyclodehydratase domain-containing protein